MTVYHNQVTEYITALSPPQREIGQLLRQVIFDNFPQMREDYKWKYPAYCYNGQRICIAGGFKRHANLELFYGAHLRDRRGLILGTGKNTRHVEFTSPEEIDSGYIVDLLRQSIELS